MNQKQMYEYVRARLRESFPTNYRIGRIPIHCKDGKIRYYNPESWAEMYARTKTRDLREAALHTEHVSRGNDLVQINRVGSTDPCREWEGEILSITGETPGYRTVAECRSSGHIFHPNCRHFTIPIVHPSEGNIPLDRHRNALSGVGEIAMGMAFTMGKLSLPKHILGHEEHVRTHIEHLLHLALQGDEDAQKELKELTGTEVWKE